MILVRSGHKQVSKWVLAASLLFSFGLTPSLADNTPPANSQAANVSMTLFPVVREANGATYILTPRGFKVNIPGVGISPNATTVSVFQDQDRNYWYIDRNNCPTEVTAQQLQWAMTQINAEAAQAQNAAYGKPMPGGYPNQAGYGYGMPPQQPQQPAAPQTVVVQQEQPQSGGSGGGSSALGTGLAAAGGAALGSVLTNSIYDSAHPYYGGMPYGVPMYREGNGRYYYNNPAGNKVYVAPHNDTANITKQWDQQGTWNNRQNWAANTDKNWANANAERNLNPNMQSNIDNRVKNNQGRFQEGFRRGGGFRRR